jgi:hypothetical protein
MRISARNYFSKAANREYMSVSQFKSFTQCEARAKAELKGEYEREETSALFLGSYVDEMLTGTAKSQAKFIEDNHSQLYKKNGEPYADIQKAMDAVERVRKQPLMMKYLSGTKQKIMTGEIGGVKWKIKMDSYKPKEFIADLKYLKDFKSPNLFESAIKYWGYDIQMAVYQEIVYQNTGLRLPTYLVIVTKESIPRVAVVHINEWNLAAALDNVKKQLPRVAAVKSGEVLPERCCDCDYCADTEVLTEPIDSDLLGMSAKQIKAMSGKL